MAEAVHCLLKAIEIYTDMVSGSHNNIMRINNKQTFIGLIHQCASETELQCHLSTS